jgi:malyl-CoA/(S)-citramalyl-CoA lyase
MNRMPALLDSAPRRFRIQRSELAVPATSQHLFEKAARTAADFVFLDLEDSVAPDQKNDARRNAIAALNDISWGTTTMAVRINALDTPWAHRDIAELVGQCPRLDLIMLPRAGAAFDVQFVDQLLLGLEKEHRREKRIGIETIVETAQGLANVEQIAASSSRLEAIIFGIGDYSMDMHAYDAVIGTSPVERDRWQYARARIANACRAFGLRPIDGPFTKYADLAGLRASAEYVAALGFEGKWAIHPTQIPICNEVFSPTPSQVEWAERTLQLMSDATAQGKGAVGHNGSIVDMAHTRLAQAILERASTFNTIPREAQKDNF